MSFGLLMRDNTPVDFPFRRSGRGAEESVSLGGRDGLRLGYVPGGPYYPRGNAMRALGNLTNVPGVPYGYVPGGPYYPRSMPVQRALGFVPGGPYYPRGIAARRFGAVDVPGVPGVPGGFGDDVPTDPMSATPLGPVYDPNLLAQSNQGNTWNWQSTVDAGEKLTTSIINAFTNKAGQVQCPAGYTPTGDGRCAKTVSSNSNTMLLLGGLGLAAVVLLSRKRG